MKELIDRISHPKPWMIVLFCFVTIFAMLAFPLNACEITLSPEQLSKRDPGQPGLL